MSTASALGEVVLESRSVEPMGDDLCELVSRICDVTFEDAISTIVGTS